ncbi:salicylic acid-binding protein 2-like [Melia azedarach]|uniref:Salicylic acid-binding protein 2-like n=1 Tax=Melia azedarach TaxID=155640 RepID=A0ACC1XY77_MELAZ|nr:salicylic acid-binding protein 2-like [Melia azedarach]
MKKTQVHLISILLSLFILFHLTANQSILQSPELLSTKHFVLVHGSCHGAWSWFKLVALIKSSGHNVTAIDLAASGVEPQQVSNLKSISDFFKPLMDFMEALPQHETVILVGHSLGGLAVSQTMERFPNKISVAVFVTALMPGPDLNISALNQESFSRQGPLMDCKYTYDDGPNNPPTTFIFGPSYLKSSVYQHSPMEDWALATMLMRPLRLFSDEDMSRELVLTREKYGSVKRVFIISEKDLVSEKDFVFWMINKNPPHQVEEIKGSDHMVIMSKPLEVWTHLLSIAKNYT